MLKLSHFQPNISVVLIASTLFVNTLRLADSFSDCGRLPSAAGGRKGTNGLHSHDISRHAERFNGECSHVEINRLIAILKKHGCRGVAGIGGGKTLDTAKAIGYYQKLPVVVIPTIASTDAPTSAVRYLYQRVSLKSI